MSTDPRPGLIRQIAALPRVIDALNTLAWRDVMSDALEEMDAVGLALRKVPGVLLVGDIVELTGARPLTRTMSAKPGARAVVGGPPHMLGGLPHVPLTWVDAIGQGARGHQSDGSYDVRDFDHVEVEEAQHAPPPPADALAKLKELAAGYRKFSAIRSATQGDARGVVDLVMDSYRVEAADLKQRHPGLPDIDNVEVT